MKKVITSSKQDLSRYYAQASNAIDTILDTLAVVKTFGYQMASVAGADTEEFESACVKAQQSIRSVENSIDELFGYNTLLN